MLDMQDNFEIDICDKLYGGPLDPCDLVAAIKSLSPSELAALEDELDFAQFTGIRSERMRAIISSVSDRHSTIAA